MQYRTFQKTGEPISLLGLGLMRLPEKDDKVDEAEAIRMIRAAIDAGVNYLDTAYVYHGGDSEIILGKALKDGYREKVLIADKMPVWVAKDAEDQERMFEEQFTRLGVDVIDMYLVHAIEKAMQKRIQRYDTIKFLEKKKAEGRIKHIGFSFHDSLDLFKETIDSYPWDFCMIQLNYMDANFQAGVEGLKYAGAKGIPVVVMEPLKGGRLTDYMPESIQKLWGLADIKRSPADWALRWVADFPEVLTVVSGTSSVAQLEENVKILSDVVPNSLTDKEKDIIQQVADTYRELIQYDCTDCRYCLPCPQKINIPLILMFYNEWFMYEQNPKVKGQFNFFIPKDAVPSVCTACGTCEERCPQKLPVMEALKKAGSLFE